MQDCELQMLEALRAHLSKDTPACILESAEDWTRLWTLSSQQKILGMVVDGLAPVLPKEAIGPSVRGNVLQGAAVQLQKTMAFQNLYQGLLDRGFTPVVVKGILCRSLYPKPDLRPSADEDLLIQQEEMAGVLEYLRRGGMILEHEEDEQVVVCRDPKTGLYLELHRQLFFPASPVYGGWNGLFSYDVVRERVDGGEVYTLTPGEHLLYLVLHSFKHFLHSGFGIRQVCDICLFAQTYGQDIDWSRVDRAWQTAHAEVFGANLLEIGRRYLGFDSYPPRVQAWMEGYARFLDCDALLEDLLSGGIYGGSTEERKHSSRITLNAVAGGDSHGSEHRLLRTVFPRREELVGQYPYLQRHGWLLPLAWGSRVTAYVRKGGGRKQAKESIAIGEHRVALMKKYRVIP